MPKKSHSFASTPVRRQIEREPPKEILAPTHTSLKDVTKKITGVKGLENWSATSTMNTITLKLMELPSLLPMYEIVIDASLGYFVSIYGWRLPDDHRVYKEFRRSLQYHTTLSLVEFIQDHNICTGNAYICIRLLSSFLR